MQPALLKVVASMDFKLELVGVPVSDVDRAIAFYVDRVRFTADNDVRVQEGMRHPNEEHARGTVVIKVGQENE